MVALKGTFLRASADISISALRCFAFGKRTLLCTALLSGKHQTAWCFSLSIINREGGWFLSNVALLHFIIVYSVSSVHSSGHQSRLVACHMGFVNTWNTVEDACCSCSFHLNKEKCSMTVHFMKTALLHQAEISILFCHIFSLSKAWLSVESSHQSVTHGFGFSLQEVALLLFSCQGCCLH